MRVATTLHPKKASSLLSDTFLHSPLPYQLPFCLLTPPNAPTYFLLCNLETVLVWGKSERRSSFSKALRLIQLLELGEGWNSLLIRRPRKRALDFGWAGPFEEKCISFIIGPLPPSRGSPRPLLFQCPNEQRFGKSPDNPAVT